MLKLTLPDVQVKIAPAFSNCSLSQPVIGIAVDVVVVVLGGHSVPRMLSSEIGIVTPDFTSLQLNTIVNAIFS